MMFDDGFLQCLLDNLYDGVYYVNSDRVIKYWNAGAKRLTGYEAHDVVGRSCKDNLLVHMSADGVMLCSHGCPLTKVLRDGKERQGQVSLKHADGHRVAVQIRVAAVRDSAGRIVGAVEVFSDNSTQVAAQQRIEELEKASMEDPLTQLANRRFLAMKLEGQFAEFSRYGVPFGVIMMDIDDFKSVNDRFGHDVGDRAIKMVANTLRGHARVFDVVCRWGGEEFLVVARHVDQQKLDVIADRYRRLVEGSEIMVGDQRLGVTVSSGLTLARHGDTADTLLKRVDMLLYQSKSAGRNRLSTDGAEVD